jgi:hypothetical protein
MVDKLLEIDELERGLSDGRDKILICILHTPYYHLPRYNVRGQNALN